MKTITFNANQDFELPRLGIIGGTGLSRIPNLEDRREIVLETPFGAPSAALITGELHGFPVAFLARHGQQHTIPPQKVNYRANIYALKMLGVTQIISISACGSLRQDYAPGELVVPNQLVDRTWGRETTYFDQDLTAHIGVNEPFCPDLSNRLILAAQASGLHAHSGGTSITIPGPRFSTKAESDLYRSWAVDIIGMTTSPEAFLAREAEICFAVLAHLTDYDVWLVGEDPVSSDTIRRSLHHNTQLILQTLEAFVQEFTAGGDCACHEALKTALATPFNQISPKTRQRLSLLIDKYDQPKDTQA